MQDPKGDGDKIPSGGMIGTRMRKVSGRRSWCQAGVRRWGGRGALGMARKKIKDKDMQLKHGTSVSN